MSPRLMSPFFVKKQPTYIVTFVLLMLCRAKKNQIIKKIFPSKTCFFDKEWTHYRGAHVYKIIK